MEGTYIYGIIGSGVETRLGASTPGPAPRGTPVYTIAHQGLSCVVSDYSGGDLGSMPKEEVVRRLLAHQTVVERVMREHTVLPVRFGTLLGTPDDVRSLLGQGRRLFCEALAWIGDKVELEVAATWNRDQVLRQLSSEPEIVRAREAIANRPGQTLEDRIRLGQMVKALMDQRRDSYVQRMIRFLKPTAVAVQLNALLSDQMVMNVAFLVEKATREAFDTRVRRLDQLFHDQIDFRIIGPLPPYTFASVEVTRPNLEEIEEARELLALDQVASEAVVRQAYRRMAADAHPDHQAADEQANARFARLRRASDLLIAYCRAQAESAGSLIIRIRRQGDDESHHVHRAEMASVAGAADG